MAITKTVYKLVSSLANLSGVTALFNIFHDKQIRILMYHRVSTQADNFLPEELDLYVTPKVFEEQIRYLKRNYRIISLKQCNDFLKSGKRLPKKCVVITFDDGFVDNYSFAYPILEKYRAPATFFVITDTLSEIEPVWLHKLYFLLGSDQKKAIKEELRKIFGQNYLQEIKYKCPAARAKMLVDDLEKKFSVVVPKDIYLSLEQIREMKQKGHIFGSHTKSHVVVAKLSSEEKESEILRSGQELAKELGECDFIAYPFGDEKAYDKESRIVAAKSYLLGLSAREGFVKLGDDLFDLRRIFAYNCSLAEFKGSLGGVRFFLINMYQRLRG